MVGGLVADDVLFRDVTDVWSAFDRIERLASCAKTLLAARVDEAGAWKSAGARSAAEHLAKLSGTSTSVARRGLENSKELASLPGVADAMRSGELSNAQVEAIVPAVAADSSAAGRLLEVAPTTNITELREECLRTRAAADPDRDATHRRIHGARSARTYVDAGGRVESPRARDGGAGRRVRSRVGTDHRWHVHEQREPLVGGSQGRRTRSTR